MSIPVIPSKLNILLIECLLMRFIEGCVAFRVRDLQEHYKKHPTQHLNIKQYIDYGKPI